jgi:nitroreductase
MGQRIRTTVRVPCSMTQERASVWDTITTRRSVRNFSDDPVDEIVLRKCLDAARVAPSWANKQCWHFIVVNGREAVDELGIIPAHIKNAPAVIVACGDPEKSGKWEGKDYYLVDVAIATEHLVLQAWELGLGTCWVGAFKEDKIRKLFDIPESIRVVAIIPIGYPANKETIDARVKKEAKKSDQRKDREEIVHYNKW